MAFRRAVATLLLGAATVGLAGCSGAEEVQLGPKDGFDLPPTDLERVAIGDEAPDFSLEAYTGDTLTLSDLRDDKNVVLVFYRGHW